MKLQLVYDLYQDRLLLSIAADGSHSQGFWLTRRMTILLWQVLVEQLSQGVMPTAMPEARNWLLAMQHEEQTAMHQPAAEPALALAQPPLLVTTLQYGRQPDGQQVIGLFDAAGNGERYVLPEATLHALIPLLRSQVEQADWGLALHWPELASALAMPPAATLQ